MRRVLLDFGLFRCGARLNDSVTAGRVIDLLPVTVKLTAWGREVYGPIGVNLGSESPVATVPPGGIAYTGRGVYLCIFFGQDPAWPVEHIGMIEGGEWRRLLEGPAPDSVTVMRNDSPEVVS